MNDTTQAAREQQIAIFNAKSAHERAMLGIEMIDTVRHVVENSIRLKQPDISQKQMTIAIIKRYYGNEFSAEKLAKIIESMS
jgi:hypothetical protein